MQFAQSLIAFVASASIVSAAPSLFKRADSSCSTSYGCAFEIMVAGCSASQIVDGQVRVSNSSISELSDGQARCNLTGSTPTNFTLSNGTVTDSSGRVCEISSQDQFQCSATPDTGATTTGFSVCNGLLSFNSNSSFIACLATGEYPGYNIYTANVDRSTVTDCMAIELDVPACASSSSSSCVAQTTTKTVISSAAAVTITDTNTATETTTETTTESASAVTVEKTITATAAETTTVTVTAEATTTVTATAEETATVTATAQETTTVTATAQAVSTVTATAEETATVTATATVEKAATVTATAEETTTVTATAVQTVVQTAYDTVTVVQTKVATETDVQTDVEVKTATEVEYQTVTESAAVAAATTTAAAAKATTVSTSTTKTSSSAAATCTNITRSLGSDNFPTTIEVVNEDSDVSGSSYFAYIGSGNSTIFTFNSLSSSGDCSINFYFPTIAEIEAAQGTTSYDISSSSIDVTLYELDSVAAVTDTYATKPARGASFDLTLTPGTNSTFTTFTCPSAQTSYELVASDSNTLSFFEDYNLPVLGLVIASC